MPPSKYDRELRFIDTETRRLASLLDADRNSMPSDPEAARHKAERVAQMEERMAYLLKRRSEILNCYKEAGMTPPYIERSLNATVYRDGISYMPDEGSLDTVDPRLGDSARSSIDELNAEIKIISKELAETEEKMLQADIDGDESQTVKLALIISSLRSRRESLVNRIKDLKANPELLQESIDGPTGDNLRMMQLQEENARLRNQVDALTAELKEIRDAVRELSSSRRL